MQPCRPINNHCGLLITWLGGPLVQGKNGKILRAAGSSGQIIKKTNKLAKIRLKSGHCRWFDIKTMATTGTVSNSDYRFIKYKKAGQSRWLGYMVVVVTKTFYDT